MTTQSDWKIAEPDMAAILDRHSRPLEELAAGKTPAIVLRSAYPEQACRQLIERLTQDELIYDPRQPTPEEFRAQSIPEGYFKKGSQSAAAWASRATGTADRTRIDIGTSLGYRGDDQEAFLQHSQETHTLFERLFCGSLNPVEILYDSLQQLSVNKKAVTAYEPDGRRYGPAIIRAHYGGYTYKPHFDSVKLREQRDNYAVHAFDHQFAGVLVLQNTQSDERTAQCVLHRCLWTPEIETHLQADTFHAYADETNVENVEVCLNPGDLYFFNTRSIHEVPGVAGDVPRIVLATFIGYSSDRDEMFVWS